MSEPAHTRPVLTPARKWAGALLLSGVVALGACSLPEEETSAPEAPAVTEAPAAPADPAAPVETTVPETTVPEVDSGFGSQDATADVGVPVMDPPDMIGMSYIRIPVINNSSGRSTYFIDLVIESADGAVQYETTTAFLNDVEPGQSATAETMVAWGNDPMPADATLRITTIQRTAS